MSDPYSSKEIFIETVLKNQTAFKPFVKSLLLYLGAFHYRYTGDTGGFTLAKHLIHLKEYKILVLLLTIIKKRKSVFVDTDQEFDCMIKKLLWICNDKNDRVLYYTLYDSGFINDINENIYDVNDNELKTNLLGLACHDGNVKLVRQMLLCPDIDLKKRNFPSINDNGNILHSICKNGVYDLLVVLIEHLERTGKSIDLCTYEEGYTPLHLACKNGYTSVVELMLSYKGKSKLVDLEVNNEEKETVFDFADGNSDIIRLLDDYRTDNKPKVGSKRKASHEIMFNETKKRKKTNNNNNEIDEDQYPNLKGPSMYDVHESIKESNKKRSGHKGFLVGEREKDTDKW